ncbi:MAG: glycine betaine ABC transporter substrate-binding protein, partial [Myxococcota bacterium]
MSARYACTASLVFVTVCVMWASRVAAEHAPVVVGSKKFTESVVLAEILTQRVRADGVAASHRAQLGGTRVLFSALEAGDVTLYPEYTGTIAAEILQRPERTQDHDAMRALLAERGVGMSRPLGFNNTYALGMLRARAQALGVGAISELSGHPRASLGFSNEFMDREDGWPGLKQTYQLPHEDIRGLDHDLAYKGLRAGTLDVIDLYSTDAEIEQYDLAVLDDDRGHFPEYQAVVLYRLDAPDAVLQAIAAVEGAIDAPQMIAMNARAKIDREPEAEVARRFVSEVLGADVSALGVTERDGVTARILRRTVEHALLVFASLAAAILLAIPAGVLAAKVRAVEGVVLGVVGVLQTIPSLALLVFMIPVLGIGTAPAIAALFVYSLLPIVRNTHAGLRDIDRGLIESAVALGLTPAARLRLVELPLAAPSILAGIKTAAVINIGTATLGALIGAGGYGQPILTGIQRSTTRPEPLGAVDDMVCGSASVR